MLNALKILLPALAALLALQPVYAEIQHVVVTWTPGLCQASCMPLLEAQFRKVPGVGEVVMNHLSARADITWKPNSSFSFRSIEAAIAMIGLSYDDIRVRARGTLKFDDAGVWLISSGDETRFMLLNPMQINPGQHNEFYNIESHRLTPDTRQKLIAADYINATVTIEGPLFSPERSPPLALIIERMQIETNNQPEGL